MTKNNHLLASYDDAGNFTPIGDPQPYDTARDELIALLKSGSNKFDRVALINLRSGIRKRRPIGPAAKKTTSKK